MTFCLINSRSVGVLAGFAHWTSPRRGTAKRGVSGHRNDRVNLHWDADPGDLSVCGKGG